MASAEITGRAAATPSSRLYLPPRLTGDEPLGSILRSEPLQAPEGVSARAVLYVSTGLRAARTVVSGIVLSPDEARPGDRRPIIAWAHYTAGLADQCAPSHAGVTGDLVEIARPFLADGWVVAATDYEGLGTPGPHPYMVGLSEGRSVLDSIRAARALPDCGTGSDVAVVGLSQGGHAALWTAELASGYAPELGLRAVVAAAPGGDLAALARWLAGPDGTPVGWLNAILVLSAWHEVYGLPLENALTPKARKLAAALQTSCPDYSVAVPDQPLTADLSVASGWRDQLEANTPGSSRARTPILILQGTEDEQVPLHTTLSAVERLRAAGNDVELRILDGADHEASLFGPGRLDDIHAWISDRIGPSGGASPNREPSRRHRTT
jgi:pimeloyl-ACP methyl ester carboxylesterase